MNFEIICSENFKKVLCELILKRNHILDSNASVAIVEKNFDLPEGKISIVIDYPSLGQFINFLDDISKSTELPKEFILGKSGEKYELINYDKILYFESSNNDTFCMTIDGTYKVREKIYELEKNLVNAGFIRVGKAFLVNILSVNEITPWFGGRLNLTFKKSNLTTEVSRNYVKGFKDYLGM